MRLLEAAAIAAIAISTATLPVAARELRAAPGEAAAALAAAEPGDTVTLARGIHRGSLRVLRPVVLRGEPGAVVAGPDSGSVLEVAAAGAVLEDFEVRGSGRSVMTIDAGIHVITSPRVTLRRLRLHDVLYGVYGERADELSILDCRLTGRVTPGDERGEGNGIHLWHCERVRLRGVVADRFLDAIYLSFVDRSRIEGNVLADCGRYGLHTMYCQELVLSGNRFTRNLAGCAIMFANHLEVTRNEFVDNRGARTYGLLLRDCSDGRFVENRMIHNTVAVFLDNSNRNQFRRNLVQDNGWGILLFSSCAGNEFAANNLVHNDYPVALDMRRTDNRFDDGRTGNYWSDDAPYDLDGDGVSDVPHSPVTAFAFVSKQYPDLTVLAKSPAVAALGVAERVFPSLRPSEAVDRFPRVAPLPMGGGPRGEHRPAAPRPAREAGVGFLTVGLAAVAGIARVRRHR